jgi:O-antigen/teichoic acid export membrane protein
MRRLRVFAPDIFITILLLLLPLGFFSQQTLGGRSLLPSENLYQYEPYKSYAEVVQAPTIPHNHLLSDLVLENYQWKSFIRQQIALGEVPLWNPHQFSGIPFLAAGQHSALYPLSVIYYILPLWLAYGWFTVLNLWLAGLGMYAFTRGLGIGRSGAFLAGIIYQFCGFVIASVVFQMMIGALPWLPIILLMSEYIIRQKAVFGRKTAIPWVTIGAIALALNILAGHVEITLYSLMITGFFAGIRWLHDGMGRGGRSAMPKKAAWLMAMILLGFGLGAIQFIPLYDFVQTNWRAERSSYDTVASYAHPPRDILQFFIPNFFGSPSHHSYFDVFSGETVSLEGNQQPHSDWGVKNYVEAALYLGILPLFLAVYAAIDRTRWTFEQGGKLMEVFMREPPYRMIFGTMALLSISFSFGLPSYRLIYALPGFNQLNSPFRWIFGLTVAVAVLAAFGLDALQRRAAEKVTRGEMRFGLLTMGAGLAIFLLLAIGYFAFPQLEPSIENSLRSLTNAEKAFCIVEKVGESTVIRSCNARSFFSYEFVQIAIFGVMLFLSGLVFYWIGRMRQYQGLQVWSGFAILLVIADLMIASWGFNPASDPALLDFTPPAIQWLSQQEGGFRYTTLEPPNRVPLLNANSTWQYGLDDIRGYDSIIPAPYVDYMRDLAPQVQLDFNRVAPIFTEPRNYVNQPQLDYVQVLDSPLLSLLNVRYVVTYPDVIVPFQEWKPVYGDEAVVIWENPDALPRAYLLAEMPESWLAPERPAEIVLPTNYEAVGYSRDTGRERFLDVSLENPSWLIISENYAEGWKAFSRPVGAGEGDETPLELVPVLGIFQGVQLPAGEQTIRLVYSPPAFQIGFFGTAISAVSLTLMMGMWLWTIFVGVNTAESSQSAKVARNSIAPIALNLFNRSIDFVFAIILYRLLTQEMVGVYNLAIQVFVWFDIFTNFGLDLFLIRELSRDREHSGFYLFNTSFLRFFLSIIGVGLLLLFLFVWQNTVEPLPYDGVIAILLLYAGLFPASLSKGMTSLYYAHEQAEKPAAIATITTINKAIFGVIVLALGWGIIGLAGVSIVNNFITLGVLLWAGRGFINKFIPKLDFSLIRGMVKESYPLLLNHFLATIFFQIDIVVLQALKGSVLQAQYSTSYKWLLAINIVPSFFTQALFPVMSRQAREDKAALTRSYSLGLKLMLSLALPIAVGFTVLATPLTLILAGESYLPNAAIALTLMIWSIPIGWMNSLTQYALIAVDLQRYITRAFFVAVTFNLIANVLFVPTYSFYASAIITILSELALLIPFAYLMQRGLGQRVNWFGILWRPIVATGAMIGLIYLLLPVNMILALLVGSVVYLAVLFLLKPLEAEEIAMLPARLQNLPFLRGNR